MTPYHRLARETPGFEHWRLPVAALAGVGVYGTVSVAFVIVWMLGMVVAGADADAFLDAAGTEIALDRPSVLAFQLLSIALLIPCVLGPVAVVWRRHVGYLHSVEGRLRWGWLGRCSLLAFAVVALGLGLSVVVDAATGGSLEVAPLDGTGVATILVVLLVVPFQAAAEEYVFRGGLLQLVGSWTRWAVVPVVVTSLLFAAGHLYDFWGLFSVFLFGVVACALTIRTGGLEAAIGLHVANNVVLMVLDVLGLVDSTGEGAGLVDGVLPSLVMTLVFWGLVEWMARRTGLVRRREPLPEPPPVPLYRVVPPPPYVPAGLPPAPQPVAPQPFPAAVSRPEPPPNAPSYPGDPGVWTR